MKTSVRIAISKANGDRCLYCGHPVQFRDLEIDHITPESTKQDAFADIRQKLVVSEDFNLSSLRNLAPSHLDCNRKKRGALLDVGTIAYYLAIGGEKQNAIVDALAAFEKAAARDDVLAKLTLHIESGQISKEEVVALVQTIQVAADVNDSLPYIVCLGKEYYDARTVDSTVVKLLRSLRYAFRRPLVLSEAPAFSGDVYGLDGVWALKDATIETFNFFVAEKHGCPICGEDVAIQDVASESGEFSIATCQQCGWEEYRP
ncbi:MAG: hypothetical protein J0M17_25740 [Planctomycetes bacterium]|nr:hypothetical protein [Planctomycetota bacterium]